MVATKGPEKSRPDLSKSKAFTPKAQVQGVAAVVVTVVAVTVTVAAVL